MDELNIVYEGTESTIYYFLIFYTSKLINLFKLQHFLNLLFLRLSLTSFLISLFAALYLCVFSGFMVV